jgi:hypothetical protein
MYVQSPYIAGLMVALENTNQVHYSCYTDEILRYVPT